MLTSLVYLVIYIVVVGLVCGLLLYLIDTLGVPEPFHRLARAAVIIVGVLIVIFILLSLVDGAPPKLSIK